MQQLDNELDEDDAPDQRAGAQGRLSGCDRIAPKQSTPDMPVRILDLVLRYVNGELQAPKHQRDPLVWPRKKQLRWVQRLVDVAYGVKLPPLGIVCIYTLVSEDSLQEYLNEGLQRISTAALFLQRPHLFGDYTPERARRILHANIIYVQCRSYESHNEAARDFEEVNQGLSLEPYEIHKNILVNRDDWPSLWEGQIKIWNEAIAGTLAIYCRSSSTRRTERLRLLRQNLQLFAVAHLGRPTSMGSGSEIEDAVAESFGKSDPDKVSKHIADIKRYSMIIQNAWRSNYEHTTELMPDSLARWCIGVMLLHYDGTNVPWWNEFFAALFSKTGRETVLRPDATSDRKRPIFLTEQLSAFGAVCKELGLHLPEKKVRQKHRTLLAEGASSDHVLPFSKYGEGETQPMPSLLNSSKCASERS